MEEEHYSLHADPRLEHLTSVLGKMPEVIAANASPRPSAIGLVISLVRWTAQNAPSGNLSAFAPNVIANAITWEHDPALLIELLQESSFLNRKMEIIGFRRILDAEKGPLKWIFEETDQDYE